VIGSPQPVTVGPLIGSVWKSEVSNIFSLPGTRKPDISPQQLLEVGPGAAVLRAERRFAVVFAHHSVDIGGGSFCVVIFIFSLHIDGLELSIYRSKKFNLPDF